MTCIEEERVPWFFEPLSNLKFDELGHLDDLIFKCFYGNVWDSKYLAPFDVHILNKEASRKRLKPWFHVPFKKRQLFIPSISSVYPELIVTTLKFHYKGFG